MMEWDETDRYGTSRSIRIEAALITGALLLSPFVWLGALLLNAH